MAKFKRLEKMPYAGIIIWLGIFMLASISCKNPTSPDETSEANIIVKNECGVALDIYMDGNFQFSVEYQDSNTIRNVSLAIHDFVAKKYGTETEIMYLSVEIFNYINYEWTILSSASLSISNEFGETLSIYQDDYFLIDIDSPGVLLIQSILLGKRLMEAKRPSDDTVAASITIDIGENKEYSWTISK